jgi:hypothetical protein
MTANVPGWDLLMNGTIVSAAYVGYNEPLSGYLLLLLFCTLSAILILNSGVEVSFIIGIIFFGAFSAGPSIIGGEPWLNTTSFNIILVILALELTSVFYKMLTKT